MPDNIKKEFNEFADINNIKFFIMYGQTEATARIAYVPQKNFLKK